jgi:transposase
MRASARLSVRPIPDADWDVYERILPRKSLLLDALEMIPWDQFELKLKQYYAQNSEGQPEYPPIILLKLELLSHLYCMGRERVIERASCDLHWKFFLGLPINAVLPDQSTLCVFRKRLGVEGFKEIFDALVGVARDEGLINDRLRLKDATHIYADVAVPTSLGLFSQLRKRMLKAVRRFDPDAADVFELDVERMRERTAAEDPEIRLAARVEMVQDLLVWIRQQDAPQGTSREDIAGRNCWQVMQAAGDLADKILFDLAHPDGKDKTLSVIDPDARRGKHGQYYDGYMLDVMMDADSQLVTALNVLPANGAEARDAIDLVEAEEEAHSNDVERLSIDGIGFNGEVLRSLTDEEGLNLEVFTPPHDFNTSEGFDSSCFEMVEEGTRVMCPAGELSGRAGRKVNKPNTLFFVFPRRKCAGCPLVAACHPNFNPAGRVGRRVSKNQYEKEYQKAWEVSQSPEYAQVRREHPAIERKLNEFVRHHGARRTKHRGLVRVRIQQFMTAVAINVKRMVKLLQGGYAPSPLPVIN